MTVGVVFLHVCAERILSRCLQVLVALPGNNRKRGCGPVEVAVNRDKAVRLEGKEQI